jgi:lipopolysaccharide/colanic/teichoic acid biosynthesis glycosyltransferase
MLRRSHLDELPQLFLVVVGKMTLVGPRPEMPSVHDQHFDPVFAHIRTSVRPGCTGLWQISDHCGEMIYEHPEFDECYVRNRSLRFDLWILRRTVRFMWPVAARTLVSLDDVPSWAVRVKIPTERARVDALLPQAAEA